MKPNSFLIILFLYFGLTAGSHADESKKAIEKYLGLARDASGRMSYQESHETKFDSTGRVQSAKTSYLSPEGKIIAEMTSDFRKSITLPEYSFKDFRDNTSHGIGIEGSDYLLWKVDSEGKRTEKKIPKDQFTSDELVVGCQGLHYYVVQNLEQLKTVDDVQVKYLIPGKLDYFSFTLSKDREDDQFIHFRLSINSIFLKLFASSLKMKYRKSDRRLVFYSGLSNLINAKGSLDQVEIDYDYEDKRGVSI